MNKSAITFLLAAAASPGWPADSSGPALDSLIACSAIQDAGGRLACFDREIAPLAATRPRAARPAAVVTAPPAPAQPRPETTPGPARPSFGEEQLNASQRAPDGDEQVMHAHISELKPAGSGRFLVTLDNGQVWFHEDAFLGGYLKKGEAVTITRATLGAYRLTRDAGQAKNWIRVTRVR